ncbi:YheC/YheD family protein [Desmospora profundinema]|uniref:Glutathione synthase/RimK-type ligase-like ATP-grasp enzyme n=1 Tax=Desmospora profundinema TaxID=1571184 RepID=A0ABU1ILV8_9BACL|nr:YheC/YheD family protein [Desmospora profundinema]MDR6225761.1 glutathione synthase/RimK-type ligase-like ATP-grasp enzyme [Desmospora profundinema]
MVKIGYKWGVHRTLMGDATVAEALPETKLFQEQNLMNMLRRHSTVILKPSGGTGGYGIIQVSRKPTGRYELRWGGSRQILPNIGALLRALKPWLRSGGSRYMIQQRVNLAEIAGRPLDVRVMVQRRKGGPWTVTAHIARVAAKGLFITNVARRGTLVPVKNTLQRSTMKGAAVEKVMNDLAMISLQAAKRLGRFSPSSLAAGFDLGVDHRGKVWMLEANPKPALYIFRHNKTMYNRILQYPLGY